VGVPCFTEYLLSLPAPCSLLYADLSRDMGLCRLTRSDKRQDYDGVVEC
jgi:hypothetical protein